MPRILILLATAALFVHGGIAASAEFTAAYAADRFPPLELGWTSSILSGGAAQQTTLRPWGANVASLDLSVPRDLMIASALAAVFKPEQALQAPAAARPIGASLLRLQAEHTAWQILGMQGQSPKMAAAASDLLLLKKVLGSGLKREAPEISELVDRALTRARESDRGGWAAVRDRVAAFPIDGRAAFEASVGASLVPGGGRNPFYHKDGTRNEEGYKQLGKAAERIKNANDAELAALGQAYRRSMTQSWAPLHDLEQSSTPKEFAAAVEMAAHLAKSRPALGAAADRAARSGAVSDAFSSATQAIKIESALTMAGMIAADKDFVSYRGRLPESVDRFAAYLANSRRNGSGFIEARKWEYRDRLGVLLMLAEAMRTSNAPGLEQATAAAATRFIKSTQGILSFSELSLDGAVDAAFPALSGPLKASPAAADAVRRGFARAVAHPVNEAFTGHETAGSGRGWLALMGAVTLIVPNFALVGLWLTGHWPVMLGINAIAVLYLIIHLAANPSMTGPMRDGKRYARALARLDRLLR
jgi:hypothetical protein